MICIVLAPALALAHPLGNFTINRYSRLTVGGNQIQLTYIVDMAEIPAHQERTQIDQNGDNTIDVTEQEAYVAQLLNTLSEQLILRLNGQPQQWRLEQYDLTFPAGQAGLPTLRLVTQWTVPLDGQAAVWQAHYQDESYVGRLGWQEVVVQASQGVNLEEASVPSVDVSQELRAYPDNLLQSPLAVNQATFRFTPAGTRNREKVPSTASIEQRAPARAGQATDPFAELIRVHTGNPFVIQLALLAAFGWGAVHALSPGHGKTIVAAYLVGSRGTVRHALFLGLTTTITHTVGVLVMGLVTLFAAHFILPEKLYPWLSILSGVLVVTMGAVMSTNRLRGFLRDDTHRGHHDHDGVNNARSDHGHHEHVRATGAQRHHDHSHPHGHTHHHVPPGMDGSPVTWRSLLALGISGGLLPCPSALVLMLGAISLQRIGFGLALIAVFSLGLASVLTAIGVVLVYAGQLFQRIPESGPLFRFVPVASALVITVIGISITVQALMQMA